MKRKLFLTLALLIGMCAAAQDIVVKRDGSWIKTSHLSSAAGKYFYIAEGDSTMTLNELKRSEIGMILCANGKVKRFNKLRTGSSHAPFVSDTESAQVDMERMYRDYRSAVRLRNTGIGLMSAGGAFLATGTIMTLTIGAPIVIFFYSGMLMMVSGLPCYIVGSNRVDMMDFSMRQMAAVPIARADNFALNMTGGGGSTGFSLAF